MTSEATEVKLFNWLEVLLEVLTNSERSAEEAEWFNPFFVLSIYRPIQSKNLKKVPRLEGNYLDWAFIFFLPHNQVKKGFSKSYPTFFVRRSTFWGSLVSNHLATYSLFWINSLDIQYTQRMHIYTRSEMSKKESSITTMFLTLVSAAAAFAAALNSSQAWDICTIFSFIWKAVFNFFHWSFCQANLPLLKAGFIWRYRCTFLMTFQRFSTLFEG